VDITLYKVLNDSRPMHGGTGRYSLPTAKGPGDWMPKVKIDPCYSGYHLCHGAEHLIHWLGPDIYSVETRGEFVDADNKVVASEVRLISRVETWTDQSARLFAADCAEHVLPIFEREYPDDGWPRAAIAAARAFAKGEIDADALSAAGDAVRSAALSAARSAARAAAGATARATAWAAAGVAARAAAEIAAWAAAGAAARATSRATAGNAARAAARATVRAARNAAWSDALADEEKWQADRLRAYLRGDA